MLKLTTKRAIARPLHLAFLYGDSKRPKPRSVNTVSMISKVDLPNALSVSWPVDKPREVYES